MSAGSRPEDALPRSSLGRRRDAPYTYAPGLLEAIPADPEGLHGEQRAWIALRGLRFTCLCPVTGQPDWAELRIAYLPDAKLVESKSLKEYINSFRMHGAFHEDVCHLVCADLRRCLAPRYLEVLGLFDSRGSVAIHPFVQYARPDDPEAEALLRERRLRRAAAADA